MIINIYFCHESLSRFIYTSCLLTECSLLLLRSSNRSSILYLEKYNINLDIIAFCSKIVSLYSIVTFCVAFIQIRGNKLIKY